MMEQFGHTEYFLNNNVLTPLRMNKNKIPNPHFRRVWNHLNITEFLLQHMQIALRILTFRDVQ